LLRGLSKKGIVDKPNRTKGGGKTGNPERIRRSEKRRGGGTTSTHKFLKEECGKKKKAVEAAHREKPEKNLRQRGASTGVHDRKQGKAFSGKMGGEVEKMLVVERSLVKKLVLRNG